MNVDLILSRLDGVRACGDGWMAKCPAHKDRSASLSIGVGQDGRILLHDHAGCPAAAVVEAVGLTIGDLFPERLAPQTPHERRQRRIAARQHQWAGALPVLEFESRLVLIAAADLAAGRPLSDDDTRRLQLAIERIESARELFKPADVRSMMRDLVATAPVRAEVAA